MAVFSEFRGKTAVVTGGASGMGKGISQSLIAEGMRVFIADIDEKALSSTAAEIGAIGIRTDVSDFDNVQALARRVCELAGTVHVVCNNAGVGPVGRIRNLSIEDWRWVLNVNLWGVIHGVQAFLPVLCSQPRRWLYRQHRLDRRARYDARAWNLRGLKIRRRGPERDACARARPGRLAGRGHRPVSRAHSDQY